MQQPGERAARELYASIRYSERLAEAGIEPSVGSTGDSYDNALAETINGLYRAEIIHRRGRSGTRKNVGADLNLTHRADPILTRGWKPTA